MKKSDSGLISSLLSFIITFALFFSMAPSPVFSSDGDQKNAPTAGAYRVMEENDFPVGLLPEGVTGYELDPQTGKFSTFFNGSTCTFSLPAASYRLSYRSTITGSISKGRLKNLEGIRVKILFMWFNIAQVVRKGEELEFSLGFASAAFPVDNFVEAPQCGCGFDCLPNGKTRTRRSFFSYFFLNTIY